MASCGKGTLLLPPAGVPWLWPHRGHQVLLLPHRAVGDTCLRFLPSVWKAEGATWIVAPFVFLQLPELGT